MVGTHGRQRGAFGGGEVRPQRRPLVEDEDGSGRRGAEEPRPGGGGDEADQVEGGGDLGSDQPAAGRGIADRCPLLHDDEHDRGHQVGEREDQHPGAGDDAVGEDSGQRKAALATVDGQELEHEGGDHRHRRGLAVDDCPGRPEASGKLAGAEAHGQSLGPRLAPRPARGRFVSVSRRAPPGAWAAHGRHPAQPAVAATTSSGIASRAATTCRVSWVGVDAPEVTPTRRAPANHSGRRSAAVSTKKAGLWPSSSTTWTSRRLLLLRGLPTTTTQSTSSAASTAASWRSWVARQISLWTSICGKRSARRSMIACVSHIERVVWQVTASRVSGGNSRASTSSMVSIRVVVSGATPITPAGSGWPRLPM